MLRLRLINSLKHFHPKNPDLELWRPRLRLVNFLMVSVKKNKTAAIPPPPGPLWWIRDRIGELDSVETTFAGSTRRARPGGLDSVETTHRAPLGGLNSAARLGGLDSAGSTRGGH